mgnify:CR=1 FL=1
MRSSELAAYVSGLLVDDEHAVFLDGLAHGHLGLDVAVGEDGDADLRAELRSQRLVEPQHRRFGRLKRRGRVGETWLINDRLKIDGEEKTQKNV